MIRQLEDDLYTDLTEQQERVLDYIEDCVQEGLPPTRAEIALKFGFKSSNAAEQHVRALERKGRIRLIPGASRGIKLVTVMTDVSRLIQTLGHRPQTTEALSTSKACTRSVDTHE